MIFNVITCISAQRVVKKVMDENMKEKYVHKREQHLQSNFFQPKISFSRSNTTR